MQVIQVKENIFEGIKKAKELLGYPQIVWFRGQSDSSKSLLPSLYRYKNGKDKELEIFDRYCEIHQILAQKKVNEWDAIFQMQHYDIPTRLLDWTEVIGVAFFFAFNRHIKLKNHVAKPCIFLLDPIDLNLETIKFKGIVEDQKISNKNDYGGISFSDKNPFETKKPYAINPSSTTSRIQSQKGKFTIFGSEVIPLDEQYTKHLVKLEFEEKCIEEAKEFLENANLNEFTLIPDINGASMFIKLSPPQIA